MLKTRVEQLEILIRWQVKQVTQNKIYDKESVHLYSQ